MKPVKRALSFMLCMLMVVCMFPAQASAESKTYVLESVNSEYDFNGMTGSNVKATGAITMTVDDQGYVRITIPKPHNEYYDADYDTIEITGRFVRMYGSAVYDGGLYYIEDNGKAQGYTLRDAKFVSDRCSIDIHGFNDIGNWYYDFTDPDTSFVFSYTDVQEDGQILFVLYAHVAEYDTLYTSARPEGTVEREVTSIELKTVIKEASGQTSRGHWQLDKTETYGDYDYEYRSEPGASSQEWDSSRRVTVGQCVDTVNFHEYMSLPAYSMLTTMSNTLPRDSYYPGDIASVDCTVKNLNVEGMGYIEVWLMKEFETVPISDSNRPMSADCNALSRREVYAKFVNKIDGKEDRIKPVDENGKPTAEGTGTLEMIMPVGGDPNRTTFWEDVDFHHGQTGVATGPGNEISIVVEYTTELGSAYNIYRYKWAEGETPPPAETEKERTIDVAALLEDAAGKSMRGISVKMELIDLAAGSEDAIAAQKFISSKQGIIVGRFKNVPESVKAPAVKFMLSLTGASKDNAAQFRFLDKADPYSDANGEMYISGIVPLDSNDISTLNAGQKVRIYVGLEFGGLLLDEPYFIRGDSDFGELKGNYTIYLDQAVNVELRDGVQSVTREKRMADASVLYTVMRDAYDFVTKNLGEMEAFNRETVTVNLRSKNAHAQRARYNSKHFMSGSHFNEDAIALELDDCDCFRDDSGAFTVLHEFGHCVDYVTGGHSYHVERKSDETPHLGLFNATMNDSYVEGFATFFAMMTEKYMGYANPTALDGFVLTNPSDCFAYSAKYMDAGQEEFAIAGFLYHADKILGDPTVLWGCLKDRSESFRAVYDRICAAAGSKADDVRQLAIDCGLFVMPYAGNGKYDAGEPFLDGAGETDGEWDEGEPYYDLIFDQSGGFKPADQKKWEEYRDSVTVGVSADYNRADSRTSTPQLCRYGYLTIDGGTLDYVLITYTPENGEPYSVLRSAADGSVFAIDPFNKEDGTVTVSVPGGGVIYEFSISEQQAVIAERGREEVIGAAFVDEYDFAPSDVIPIATFGDPDAKGYRTMPEFTKERVEAGIEPDEEGETGTGGTAGGSTEGGDITKSGTGGTLVKGVIGLGAAAAAAIIITRSRKKKRSKAKKAAENIPVSYPVQPAPEPPAAQKPSQNTAPKRKEPVCLYCRSKLTPGKKFCTTCGAEVPDTVRQKPKAVYCTNCGAKLSDNARFCTQCGTKVE